MVHTAAVIIVSVRQHHRQRQFRQCSYVFRNIADSASRIDQKCALRALHEIHELLNDSADPDDMLRHPLRGKKTLLSHCIHSLHLLSLPCSIVFGGVCYNLFSERRPANDNVGYSSFASPCRWMVLAARPDNKTEWSDSQKEWPDCGERCCAGMRMQYNTVTINKPPKNRGK